MDLLTSFLIATGLAMDVFAVSIVSGITMKNMKIHRAFLMAGIFGFFHALMPTLGWLVGRYLQGFIGVIDHWVAFILLTIIGGKMIYEAYNMEEIEREKNISNIWMLLLLALATSIDALVIGLSFAILKVSIIAPVMIIGLVTFLFSLAGVYIGKHFGNHFEKKVEILGGVILILIGLKVLLQHMGVITW